MQTKNQGRVALFIDAENVSAKHIKYVLSELEPLGQISLRRAYGNWKALPAWEAVLNEHAIHPVHQFSLVKGKNASDMLMLIDIMDVLHTKDFDVFCFVSSDSDFTPVVRRCMENGKDVIGFGESKTAIAFVNSCSTFFTLPCEQSDSEPSLLESSVITGSSNEDSSNILFNLISAAILDPGNRHGDFITMSQIGLILPSNAKSFGFKNVSALVSSIDRLEVQTTDNGVRVVKIKPQLPKQDAPEYWRGVGQWARGKGVTKVQLQLPKPKVQIRRSHRIWA